MYLHGLRRLRSFKWQNRAICSCMMAQVKSPWLLLHSVEKFIRDYVLALFFFLKKIHTRLFWRCFAWKNSYETMFGAVFPGKIHTRLCLVLFCLEKFIRDYVWCCFAWKNSYETMYWCCFSWKNSYETMFGAVFPGKIHTRLCFGTVCLEKFIRDCLVLFCLEKFIRDYVWRCFTWKNLYETVLVLFYLEKFIRDYVLAPL